jgi:hypothetical protein
MFKQAVFMHPTLSLYPIYVIHDFAEGRFQPRLSCSQTEAIMNGETLGNNGPEMVIGRR